MGPACGEEGVWGVEACHGFGLFMAIIDLDVRLARDCC